MVCTTFQEGDREGYREPRGRTSDRGSYSQRAMVRCICRFGSSAQIRVLHVPCDRAAGVRSVSDRGNPEWRSVISLVARGSPSFSSLLLLLCILLMSDLSCLVHDEEDGVLSFLRHHDWEILAMDARLELEAPSASSDDGDQQQPKPVVMNLNLMSSAAHDDNECKTSSSTGGEIS